MYKCGWNGCEKAYGTLNHLNAHVTMQSHGSKRTPEGKLVHPTQMTAVACRRAPLLGFFFLDRDVTRLQIRGLLWGYSVSRCQSLFILRIISRDAP